MTTVIDASALVALLLKEEDSEALLDIALASAPPRLCSPVSVYEAGTAVMREMRCSANDARAAVADLLLNLDAEAAETRAADAFEALAAFERFGRGRHAAGLNLGDCFSLGLAMRMRAALLFKGADFAHPEVQAALRR